MYSRTFSFILLFYYYCWLLNYLDRMKGVLKKHFVRMKSDESTLNIRMKPKVPEIVGFARKVRGIFELAAKVRGTRRGEIREIFVLEKCSRNDRYEGKQQ